MKNQHFQVAIMQRVKIPMFPNLTRKMTRFAAIELLKIQALIDKE